MIVHLFQAQQQLSPCVNVGGSFNHAILGPIVVNKKKNSIVTQQIFPLVKCSHAGVQFDQTDDMFSSISLPPAQHFLRHFGSEAVCLSFGRQQNSSNGGCWSLYILVLQSTISENNKRFALGRAVSRRGSPEVTR